MSTDLSIPWDKVANAAAEKIASELPSPWGGIAKLASGQVLGLIFGADNAPPPVTEQQMKQMFEDLKGFIDQTELNPKLSYAHSFLDWIWMSRLGDVGTKEFAAWSEETPDEALKILRDGGAPSKQTLRADLEDVTGANSRYLMPDKWLEPATDKALAYVMLNLTAQVAAFKALSVLSSYLAVMTKFHGIDSETDDDAYQKYVGFMIAGANQLGYLILGAPGKERLGVGATKQQLIDEMIAFIRGPQYQEYMVDQNTRLAGVNRAEDMTGWPPLPYPEFSGYTAVLHDFSSMFNFAAGGNGGMNLGWAKAIERLVAIRQMNRLKQITPIGFYERFGTLSSDVAYYFNDGQFSYSDPDLNNVVNNYMTHLLDVGTELDRDYRDCLDTVAKWRSSAQKLLAEIPPAAPEGAISQAVPGQWQLNPPKHSRWSQAAFLRYAFSLEDGMGRPGLRGGWTELYPLHPKGAPRIWKPTITNLPTPSNYWRIRKMMVWRQFVYPVEKSDVLNPGVPEIIGYLDTNGKQLAQEATFVDADDALLDEDS
ncbi:hypothetical protein [Paraburkholderia rhynchosiae]|uniref:Uncharacterized protein n=1 Tax=Paraburkholderia rhynchosiae TaxID=487049 RepID=A0A2N7VVA2_9BURK|nr:hypothetical protein [Paraburkholderia rhynchosiae]PMS21088.1 hypothetical protein C0Z16_34150 [Paraburkholderia rhynchosiae]CAB3742096.1 hypothetical protein LMG27174_06831 [Paraburkholderia rhynchosiae]